MMLKSVYVPMLISLKIKNLALVESTELFFSSGLNVISGESGSGKSIIIGALGILLGDRADKGCIRKGEKRCEIEAVLKITPSVQNRVSELLSSFDIEDENGELLLRRVIQENSVRNYINGSIVPLKAVTGVAEIFFDFNRPDDDLSLNSCRRQLELLDAFGGIEYTECAVAYEDFMRLQKELDEFDRELPDAEALEDAKELVCMMERYGFAEDEEEELIKRHKILSNSRELINISSRASQILSGEENSVAEAFGAVMREIYALDKLTDGSLAELLEEAENVNGALNSLQNSLDIFASALELDGEALQELEDRLDVLYRLKRRFGPSAQEVFERYARAKADMERSANGSVYRLKLQERLAAAEKRFMTQCEVLSSRRREAASALEAALLAELDSLGFRKCRFEWNFETDTAWRGAEGFDRLDILFSANSGEKVLPLRKIASSGERSRLFLALKNVLAKVDNIPVVIFDEIDVNIGGETANKVGTVLHDLAKYRQIITISHLAQIACMADTHWKVEKHIRADERTVSEVHILEPQERINELARMLGNIDGARDYAVNMLNILKK